MKASVNVDVAAGSSMRGPHVTVSVEMEESNSGYPKTIPALPKGHITETLAGAGKIAIEALARLQP
jgi:hypothetical protein